MEYSTKVRQKQAYAPFRRKMGFRAKNLIIDGDCKKMVGYGVYDDYDKVLESRVYIKKFKNKKFSNLEDAKQWAVDMFYELQENDILGINLVEIKNLNWFNRVKSKV